MNSSAQKEAKRQQRLKRGTKWSGRSSKDCDIGLESSINKSP
jgi:hypothetical protein